MAASESPVAAHDARIREQFALQASTFASQGFAVRNLQWIVDELKLRGDELVLDVACGAAHVARTLAPHARHVTGIDLTPEMLEQGRRLADAEGVRNLSLLRGDAHALPFVSGQFDVVVCRWALHQVGDPAAMLREMVRVTRAGGRIVSVDMRVDDEPTVAAESNRLERLRDPSHARTLTEGEMKAMFHEAGAQVTRSSLLESPLELEDWMERTQTPAAARAEIRQRFADELAGGARTGLNPKCDASGKLTHFVHVLIMLIATRKPQEAAV